jgi:antitoxin FitA
MKGGFVSNSNHGIMAVASSSDMVRCNRIAGNLAGFGYGVLHNLPPNPMCRIIAHCRSPTIWTNGDAMTTITIPISDDRLAQLQAHARQAGLSPEEFLRRQVEQLLEQPKASFEAAANHVLEKNSELYRRLS